MSLEARILEVQSALNNKQVRSGQLTIDRLVVHQPINLSGLTIGSLTVSDLNVTNKITTKDLLVTGNVQFNGSVNMTGSTNISNLNVSNIGLRELRDVTIKGWLRVETTITAGSEIRGSVVRNAIWN